jgi:hypothetical protein
VSRLADTTFEQFVADQDLQEIVLWRLVSSAKPRHTSPRNCATATHQSNGATP